MAFTQTQVRKLAGKLPERFVKSRIERGMTLSYVEGWHVIDEANRVFGFDGWDRETVSAECVWQDARVSSKACSYVVRVRIRVRAGKTVISREGSGIGHGTGATLGEAHESALKEAETDATKRALVTFGNLFGLALYDKEQAGVQRAKGHQMVPMAWTLVRSDQPPQSFTSPHQFCSAAKEALRQVVSVAELEALWTANAPVVTQLRAVQPELRARSGIHYGDLLESLYRQRHDTLKNPGSMRESSMPTESAETPSDNSPTDQSATADPSPAATPALLREAASPVTVVPLMARAELSIPRRIRDIAHLRYIASLPCLVCGRTPSHAHHLRFAQPRSLGSKVSDELTVPICPIHHRSLHDAGREEEWWQAKGIDAKSEAERQWRKTHALPSLVAATSDETSVLEPPPVDEQGQPLPINVRANTPHLGDV